MGQGIVLPQIVLPPSETDVVPSISGDNGQRFEVRATQRASGKEFVIGWISDPKGGGIAKMLRGHPEWKDVRVVDRLDKLEAAKKAQLEALKYGRNRR